MLIILEQFTKNNNTLKRWRSHYFLAHLPCMNLFFVSVLCALFNLLVIVPYLLPWLFAIGTWLKLLEHRLVLSIKDATTSKNIAVCANSLNKVTSSLKFHITIIKTTVMLKVNTRNRVEENWPVWSKGNQKLKSYLAGNDKLKLALASTILFTNTLGNKREQWWKDQIKKSINTFISSKL